MLNTGRTFVCILSKTYTNNLSYALLYSKWKDLKKCLPYIQNRGKKDDTSLSQLFVPVPVKPNPDDINVGAELTGSLNKGEMLKLLNQFYQKKDIRKLAMESGLDSTYMIHYKYIFKF